MFTPSALLSALLLFQDVVPQQAVERLHDVASLVEVVGFTNFEFDLSPVPCGRRDFGCHGDWSVIAADDLVDVLRRLIRRKGGDDEFRIESEGSSLRVVAPEPVHVEIDRLIGELRSALVGEGQFEVRAISLRDDGSVASDAVVLDPAESDRRVQELFKTGRPRVARVATMPFADDCVFDLEKTLKQKVVKRFGIEIGGCPVKCEPVPEDDEEGLSARFRASRVDGATVVDLAVRVAERVEPMRRLTVEPKLWFVEPKLAPAAATGAPAAAIGAQMFHGTVPLTLDLPAHRFLSIAGSFVVPDGKALWIPCRIATRSGPVSFILDVRTHGPHRPVLRRITGTIGSRELAIVHVGSLRSHGFEAAKFGRRSFDLRRGMRPEPGVSGMFDQSDWPSCVEANASVGEDFDLTPAFSELPDAGPDVQALVLEGRSVLIDADDPISDSVTQRFVEAARTGRSLELHGRILRGGESLAEFRLTAMAGRTVTIWSGVDGAYLRDWDCDVADITQVGSPIVSWYLDGFALAFTVGTELDGSVPVTVNGSIHLLDQLPTQTPTGNPYTPVVESVKARRLFIDGSAGVGTNARSPPSRFGGSPLALELTVVTR